VGAVEVLEEGGDGAAKLWRILHGGMERDLDGFVAENHAAVGAS